MAVFAKNFKLIVGVIPWFKSPVVNLVVNVKACLSVLALLTFPSTGLKCFQSLLLPFWVLKEL